jgi:hypothetical protein
MEDQMSKFVDRLKQLSEGTPQPIGFRLGMKASPKLKIQLIGMLTNPETGAVADNMNATDAVIIKTESVKAASKEIKPASGDANRPVGVYVTSKMVNSLNTLIGDGADFVVLTPNLPLTVMPDKKTGKVIEIESTVSDSILRAVSMLPVDAVMVSYHMGNEVFSWEDLLAIQRLTASISKPILVPVPAGITAEEMQTLWEAGVDGVVVEITAASADKLPGIRQIIDKLEHPDTSRRDRLTPTVPRMSPESEEHEDEEEEEDDE